MRTQRWMLVWLMLLLGSLALTAAESTTDDEGGDIHNFILQKEGHLGSDVSGKYAVQPNTTYFEFGGSVGTPALLQPHFGIWYLGGAPIMIRTHAAYWGEDLHGIEADFGWIFSHQRKIRHYLMLAAGYSAITWGLFDNEDRTSYYVGPKYGFMWRRFFMEVGLAYERGERQVYSFVDGDYTEDIEGVKFTFNIGFSFVF